MSFDPTNHLIEYERFNKKLNKKVVTLYLPAKFRIKWLREDNPKPEGIPSIRTEMLSLTPPVFKATVFINGEFIADGHGSAIASEGAVWTGREVEKAETAAIARALGHAGYGTEFVEDDDENDLADSPIEPPAQRRQNRTENESGNSEQFRDRADIDKLFASFRKHYDPNADDAAIAEYAGMLKPYDVKEWNGYGSRKAAWNAVIAKYEALQAEAPKSGADVPF